MISIHYYEPLIGYLNKSYLKKKIISFVNYCFSTNLPNDSLQRLHEEIEHLKERFIESITELETRTTFIKKTIKVS